MRWIPLVVSLALALTACAQPSPQPEPLQEDDSALAPQPSPEERRRRKFRPVKWPMTFKSHSFSARCFDTLTCSIWYAGGWWGDRKPSPGTSYYGDDYLDRWRGGHIDIHNFPAPANVTWRSTDGSEHTAEIDIGKLFRDERIRHHVPRQEVADIPEGAPPYEPSIMLEVNDRTICVYTRTAISTRHYRLPGNPYSAYRDDVIVVKTYRY